MPDERDQSGKSGEFDIIARYFAPLATNPAALGLLDDAAVLSIPEGQELVATCDTIIAGVHFLSQDPPDTIAYKALATSLSDLAAKGARPHVYLLSVAFGERPLPPWLEAFAIGLQAAQEESGIDLVGGDTCATLGPLTVTVTAIGLLPQGEAVLRRGAMAGDRLYVSGTIGDAALGLRLLAPTGACGRMGPVRQGGRFSRRSLPLPVGADRARLAAAAMRPRCDRRLRWARRRYGQALHGLRRQRHDRGGARAALGPRRQGSRQEA